MHTFLYLSWLPVATVPLDNRISDIRSLPTDRERLGKNGSAIEIWASDIEYANRADGIFLFRFSLKDSTSPLHRISSIADRVATDISDEIKRTLNHTHDFHSGGDDPTLPTKPIRIVTTTRMHGAFDPYFVRLRRERTGLLNELSVTARIPNLTERLDSLLQNEQLMRLIATPRHPSQKAQLALLRYRENAVKIRDKTIRTYHYRELIFDRDLPGWRRRFSSLLLYFVYFLSDHVFAERLAIQYDGQPLSIGIISIFLFSYLWGTYDKITGDPWLPARGPLFDGILRRKLTYIILFLLHASIIAAYSHMFGVMYKDIPGYNELGEFLSYLYRETGIVLAIKVGFLIGVLGFFWRQRQKYFRRPALNDLRCSMGFLQHMNIYSRIVFDLYNDRLRAAGNARMTASALLFDDAIKGLQLRLDFENDREDRERFRLVGLLAGVAAIAAVAAVGGKP